MSTEVNFKRKLQETASNATQVQMVPASLKTTPHAVFDVLPDNAWLREAQLVRSSKSLAGVIAPLPFSAPTLWRLVRAGKFPKPTKLSAGVTAWQVGQVRAWMSAQAMV
jgi:predicted DNA-binding transcriptional regulator AlpA